MSVTAHYGYGVLSEGEVILSAEQDRLIAKRAWMQLTDHLMRHDERVLANQVPVPWDLTEDPDINRRQRLIAHCLSVMADPEQLKKYLQWDEESHSGYEQAEAVVKGARGDYRKRWMIDQVIASNPQRVLNVGAGFGSFEYELSRMGIHVVSLAPHENSVAYVKSLQEEQNLPITWVHDILENFNPEEPFEMVLLGEVLEHVVDHEAFIERACGMSSGEILITTPFGSVDKGFQPKDAYSPRGQHVRAYSWPTIAQLTAAAERCGFVSNVETLPSTQRDTHLPDLDKQFFCIHMKRVRIPVDSELKTEEVSHA